MLNPALVLFSRKKASGPLTAHASRDALHPKGNDSPQPGGSPHTRARVRNLFSAVVVLCRGGKLKTCCRTCARESLPIGQVQSKTHMGAFRKFPHAHAWAVYL